jgi:small GTP-binding protein
MVFFNYSTMQMAAKIVFYGPGLCGKTTNLQHIYGHTSNDSRGEMVSLETETDRTLFFDLLPIDVGTIAGFKTRIQLYTVPGQVFYNTTRKLVLKGVDGVVFVADSQRPMLQANVESFANLEENLAEIGLKIDEIPLVLQYNKRDLADVCTVEEMDAALNKGSWPSFEASALTGEGVFETLKGISKVTLLSIKQKMQKEETGSTSRPAAPTPRPAPRPMPSSPPSSPPVAAQAPAAPSAPAVAAAAAVAAPQAPIPAAQAAPQPAAPQPAAPQPVAQPAAQQQPVAPPVESKKQVDILAELEKIRRQATARDSGAAPESVAAMPNGESEIAREIQRTLSRVDFSRAKTFKITLQVEDEASQIIDAFQEQMVVDNTASLAKLLLKLNIALSPE